VRLQVQVLLLLTTANKAEHEGLSALQRHSKPASYAAAVTTPGAVLVLINAVLN
jgi:hypothetical protein